MKSAPRPEFSFPVDVTSLPQAGRHYQIEASEDERAAVAARLGVGKVTSLKAAFDLVPRAGGIVRVTGRVESDLTQACVVTLAPVRSSLSEEIEARFTTMPPAKSAPKTARKGPSKAEEEIEEIVGLGDEDPPEEALDGHIDLGELAVVQLALGVDPYPRAPGAAFQPSAWDEKDEKSRDDSPFAVLAKLKKQTPPTSY